MAKLVTLIETEEPRGGGTTGDPCRLVTRWYTTEGLLVVELDPWRPPQVPIDPNLTEAL